MKSITSLELLKMINEFRQEEGNNSKYHHSDLLKKIRKEIEIYKELGIQESTYKDKKGEQRPLYILNFECVDYLRNLSKYDIRAYCYVLETYFDKNIEVTTIPNIRKEILIDKILQAWFDEEYIERQYQVLNYKIDYYIKECNLIIEYDEFATHHSNKYDEDCRRMEEITDYLFEEWRNDPDGDAYDQQKFTKKEQIFQVVRIKEFEEEKGLNELFEILTGDDKVCSKLKNLNR